MERLEEAERKIMILEGSVVELQTQLDELREEKMREDDRQWKKTQKKKEKERETKETMKRKRAASATKLVQLHHTRQPCDPSNNVYVQVDPTRCQSCRRTFYPGLEGGIKFKNILRMCEDCRQELADPNFTPRIIPLRR